MIATLMADLRFAGRMLRKSPVFALVAVLVISLGTGAVTTIYTVMNALLFRPIPGAGGGSQLVGFELTSREGEREMRGSYAWYEYLRDRARSLDGVAGWTFVNLTIADRGEGTAANGAMVTGNFFSVLGVRPALGRFFTRDEDATPRTHPVVVLSHGLWQRRFGADSSVIGRAVTVSGHPFTVIGVAPPRFLGVITVSPADLWVPVMMQPLLHPTRDLTNSRWLRVFARARPDASVAQVQAETGALTAQHAASLQGPSATRWTGTRVSGLRAIPEDARVPFLGFLGVLFGAAGLVLLIASVNVASMLSARAIARRREMALRTALGAGRMRLVRQMLTETVVLFAFGALGGALLALVAARGLEQLRVPVDANLALTLSPDPRVFVFTLAVSLATGLAFGLAPALRASRRDITARLRDDSAAGGTRRGRLGNALIVGQLALSLVLLVAAGLFLRALDTGRQVEPGFEAAGVHVVRFEPRSWGYDDLRARAFFDRMLVDVAALPGVVAVSYASDLPLTAANSSTLIRLDGVDPGRGPKPAMAGGGMASGTQPGDDDGVRVSVSAVGPDYFTLLRLAVVEGRAIAAADDERAGRVAVVNETFARRFWPRGSALGRTFVHDAERVTIVGVARDAKYASLGEVTPAFVYFPIAQEWQPDRSMAVRSDAPADPLAAALRSTIQAADPALPRADVRPLTELNTIVLFPQRIAAIVTAVLGALGLVLATVGLYGIIAYSAGRRTREIGVRVALGARRADVLRLVVREGVRLALAGVVIGLLLAAGATRLITGLLFEVSPLDGVTFAAMALLFLAVALLASYLPARRAAATDPMTALRTD